MGNPKGAHVSTQLDLSSYLEDQAEEGTKDSEGDFTISHQNARRKLAKFALPRKMAWVSKLVQAAVGWKMKEIIAGQSDTATQFFFYTDTPSDLPTENEIVSTLLSGNVAADTPVEHFCLALRAVVEQAEMSFILAINDGDLKPKPIYAGPYYAGVSEADRLSDNYDRGVGITLTVRHAPDIDGNTPILNIINQGRFGIPIVEELKAYAYTCPIPIVLSGLHIEGFLDSPIFQGQKTPLYLSGISSLENSPEELPLPPSYEEKFLSYLTHPRRARRSYGGRKKFACAFTLSSKPHNEGQVQMLRRSTFNWIRDGVVVQTNSLYVPTRLLGLSIYANAEGLRSDLTGFQLVESEDRKEREQEVLEKVGVALGGVLEQVEEFLRRDTDERSGEDEQLDQDAAFRTRVKTLLGGSGMGILLTLVNPPLGLGATAISVAKTYAKDLLVPDQEHQLKSNREALRTKLKVDLQELARALRKIAEQILKGPDLDIHADLDLDDDKSISTFMEAKAEDPVGLIDEIRERMKIDENPKLILLLARAHRMADRPNAPIYYKRYLEKQYSREVAEELYEYYKSEGKHGLAELYKQRFMK